MYDFLRQLNAGMVSPRLAQGLPRFAEGGVIGGVLPAKPQGGSVAERVRGLTNQFFLSPDRQGDVNRRTLMQISAATAAGLSEASRRNN